ncbi:MAG: AMP-binding protein [Bacillota bacterium]|nr:AMP-binding protein [Bacillota bacterium]
MKNKTGYYVREVKNLKDLLNQSRELFGDKNAFLVKKPEGEYEGITYKQFYNDINSFGTALLNMGLKNKFVAVIGENRYEWCVTYLSTVNGVGTIVPLDRELPEADIENLLNRCEAEAVVFSGKHSGVMRNISNKVSSVKYFINMDLDQDRDGFLSFKQILNAGSRLMLDGDRAYQDIDIDSDKMNILIFTSGTTGFAKGVMLSHRNICSNIVSVCSTVKVTDKDSSLSILPLHHTYECTLGFLAMIYNGCTIAFCEGLKHIGKNLKEVSPTFLIAVPLILENMYKKIWEQASKKKGMGAKLKAALVFSNILNKFLRIDIRKRLFKQIHDNLGGKVRLIITGAAAIDPKVSKGLRHMGILVVQGYGLTECSPLAIGNRDYIYKDSAVGLPLPGVKVKLKDPDVHGIGELVVKGDNVMLGYFKDEEATRKSIKDGWFHTGDLGCMNKSGFYYITGRCKNVIVTKNGKNIYPEELEACINKNPLVQESLVWGCYEEQSGETHVNAQIFPNLEAIKEKFKISSISKDELLKIFSDIVKNVNKDMPLYKRIKHFSIRETEFIKTTTKKIKRFAEGVS